jgi:nicotinamide-nucleotide amidase
MERRFNQSRDQLRANLRRQTLVPVRGGYLKNPHGTAVGLVFDSGASVVVALPGPPRELQAMTTAELVPFLQRRFGIHELGASLTVRFVGAGQSMIDQVIKDHLAVPPGVIITSLFEGGRVDFTFSLPGHSADDREVLKRLEAGIRQHLGGYLYASDGSSLEDVLANNLFARGGSLSLLEIGSGGAVAGALTGASRGNSLLASAFVAPTGEAMAKLLAIPPKELPEAPLEQIQRLATAAADKTGSQWIAGTSSLLTDAAGAKSLWAVCRLPNGRWQSQRLPVRGSDQVARGALNTQIIDFLWKCSQLD